ENMVIFSDMTYKDQYQYFKQVTSDLGHPDIEMISLEWNIGSADNSNAPTEAQAALMVSEQFMQFIQAGMYMATFWPIEWPSRSFPIYRPLLNSQNNYDVTKKHGMFNLFKSILGNEKVQSI